MHQNPPSPNEGLKNGLESMLLNEDIDREIQRTIFNQAWGDSH